MLQKNNLTDTMYTKMHGVAPGDEMMWAKGIMERLINAGPAEENRVHRLFVFPIEECVQECDPVPEAYPPAPTNQLVLRVRARPPTDRCPKNTPQWSVQVPWEKRVKKLENTPSTVYAWLADRCAPAGH